MTHAVYLLLHFSQPVSHARHYVGYTSLPVEERVARHVKGDGSPLVRALVRVGGRVEIAAVECYPTSSDARDRERAIKRRAATPPLCPVCRANKKREAHP